MALRLELQGSELVALTQQAEVEGRAVEDVVRRAVRDYLARTRRQRLDHVLDDQLDRYAEALDHLR